MTGRSCGICGEAIADAARYCSHCGAPLDATVVSLDRAPDAGTRGPIGAGSGGRPSGHRSDPGSEAHVVTSRRPSRLLVGAAVALLAIGAVALVAAPDGDDASAPHTQPIPDATPRDDAPRAIPTRRPTATPQQSPTAIPTAAPTEPGDLPPMEAGHVAVIGEDTLEFLDLRTGIWTPSTRQSSFEPQGAQSVRAGVVVPAVDGSWLFASVDGGEVIDLAGGPSRFALVGEEVLVTSAHDGDTSGIIEAHRFDGSVAWTAPLPIGGRPFGITRDGQLILQLAERIVALDGATGVSRVVATGDVLATFDDSVVLWSCDQQLRCATSQLDVTTGATTVISERRLSLEPAGSGRFVGGPQAADERQMFAVVDGVLTEIDDDVAANATRDFIDPWIADGARRPVARGARAAFDTDPSGVTVAVERGTIRFTTPDGEVTTIVAPPAAGPNAVLRLVTAD